MEHSDFSVKALEISFSNKFFVFPSNYKKLFLSGKFGVFWDKQNKFCSKSMKNFFFKCGKMVFPVNMKNFLESNFLFGKWAR